MSRPGFRLAPLALLLALASAAPADDLRDLFDGRTLNGWVVEGPAADKAGRPMWSVEDGRIVCLGRGFGFLRYDRQEFSDFTLRVEYRFAPPSGDNPRGNSGLGIRTGRFDPKRSRETRPSYGAFEVQLLDDAGSPPSAHGTGSLYRYKGPSANPARPAPEWNTIEVRCDGPRITIRLNGQTILEADQSELPDVKSRPAGVPAPKDKPRWGYVALQSHSGRVEFRKVQVRETAITLRAEPPDRQVAEWVILMGGSVRREGQDGRIRDLTQLPATDFHLELVDLVGTNVNPPDLQRLNGLPRLKILNLPGPMWNPGSGATIDYSRELRHVASLRSLEELTFSDTYLESIKFEDPGIEAIAPLAPTLRLLSLENTQVRGRHLAPLTNLEALDLVYCPVDDEGLRQMQGLTKLTRLLLRDAVISDDGLRSLSGLVNLEQLDVGGTKVADVGIAHLRGMTKLKKLNLQGAALTDEGIRHLANMRDLEELNLYGTKVSNVGVEVLRGLTHLGVVDLRYTRMTRAGVDRLKASLPRCEVSFLDPTVRPGLPEGADRIVAGRGDEAVARWVRSIGGRALIENGRLREISLAGTGVSDELLRNLEGLKHLRKLELGSTEIGDLGVRHLATLSGLEVLDLDGATISDEDLAPLAGLKGLRELRLSHSSITGAGLRHLRGLSLVRLNLSSSPINDQGLAHLSGIASLRDLALAYTDVTDAGLAHLESLGTLCRLDLGGTDIGDKGIRRLGRLRGLSSLLLSYTRITDASMPQLQALEHLQELALIRIRITDKSMPIVGRFADLVSLNLDYTNVGDKGLEALAGLTKLERLSLDSTSITDASIQRLQGFRQLRELNLYHTFVTEKGHRQLRESVPRCEIIFDARSSDPKRRRS
jgi:Leucine-rich repeat (LRR) protein